MITKHNYTCRRTCTENEQRRNIENKKKLFANALEGLGNKDTCGEKRKAKYKKDT